MQTAQQLDPGLRAQRLEEAAVHAGKINGPLARHAAHRIRTGRTTPPSIRQPNSACYAVKAGEVNGYVLSVVSVAILRLYGGGGVQEWAGWLLLGMVWLLNMKPF